MLFALAGAMNMAASLSVTLSAEPQFGIEQKKPVFAGACRGCPWGVLGVVTKEAMSHYGYAVAQCFNCWGPHGPRLVADKQKPQKMLESELDDMREQAPDGIADFGGTYDPRLIAVTDRVPMHPGALR